MKYLPIMYRINLALNIEKCQLFENLYKNFDLLKLLKVIFCMYIMCIGKITYVLFILILIRKF